MSRLRRRSRARRTKQDRCGLDTNSAAPRHRVASDGRDSRPIYYLADSVMYAEAQRGGDATDRAHPMCIQSYRAQAGAAAIRSSISEPRTRAPSFQVKDQEVDVPDAALRAPSPLRPARTITENPLYQEQYPGKLFRRWMFGDKIGTRDLPRYRMGYFTWRAVLCFAYC